MATCFVLWFMCFSLSWPEHTRKRKCSSQSGFWLQTKGTLRQSSHCWLVGERKLPIQQTHTLTCVTVLQTKGAGKSRLILNRCKETSQRHYLTLLMATTIDRWKGISLGVGGLASNQQSLLLLVSGLDRNQHGDSCHGASAALHLRFAAS